MRELHGVVIMSPICYRSRLKNADSVVRSPIQKKKKRVVGV